jgi:hypothetical protein
MFISVHEILFWRYEGGRKVTNLQLQIAEQVANYVKTAADQSSCCNEQHN